jgi:hypothetical protein
VARAASHVPAKMLFAGGLIGLGLTDMGVANAGNLATPGPAAIAVAAAFMVAAGFPVVGAFAAGNGLLQRLTDDAFRGRVFGALGAVSGLATLAGLAAGGAAIDAIGVVPVVSAGGAMWIAAGLFALARLPRQAGETPHVDVTRERDSSDS